jgi:glucose-1-phosphate thymidylyltransferase
MIYYPVEAMAKAGISEVLITSSSEHSEDIEKLLGSGEEFGLKLMYAIQDNPKGGISDAIMLAEEFAKGESILVILGDNIFNFDLNSARQKFEQLKTGAMVFGVKMPTESGQYGVIEVDDNGNVLSIEEKPQHPKSDIAQTGIYMYDSNVFSKIKNLSPSARGELEVTDLNNLYVNDSGVTCELIDWWIDAGTSYDELLRANNMVAEKVKNGELS